MSTWNRSRAVLRSSRPARDGWERLVRV